MQAELNAIKEEADEALKQVVDDGWYPFIVEERKATLRNPSFKYFLE